MREELLASIADLERALADAPSEMRTIMEEQLRSARATLAMLDAATPAMEAARAASVWSQHPAFSAEPPEPPPAWIEDSQRRDTLDVEAMRCPAGATVYSRDAVVECAFAGEAGVRLSLPHGLRLVFRDDGNLARQEFFERGALRWSIEYHRTGARASEGHYVGDEPKTYIEHGLHTRYTPDGTVVAQTRWVAGRRHGWQRLWEEDGRPIVATRFSDDREVERVTPDLVARGS